MVLHLIKTFFSENKNLFKKIFIILVSVITFFIVFSLSPQWCLSKENAWKANELDMTIFVSESYQTNFYECFNLYDAEQYNHYFSGEIRINDHIEKISFRCEDQFQWITFGNDVTVQTNSTEDWFVIGEFKTVLNSKILVFKIEDVYGSFFPENIKKLTFQPLG